MHNGVALQERIEAKMAEAERQLQQPSRLEDLPDIMTPAQVAAILQCTVNHVYVLCREKILPARKVGRLVRIPKAAFLRWLESDGDAR